MWASVHSPTRALLSPFLFTDVGDDNSPTLLLRGSHMDVAAVLGGAGDEGLEWTALESFLPAAAFEREIVAAAGAAGGVYLCHHSGAPSVLALRGPFTQDTFILDRRSFARRE